MLLTPDLPHGLTLTTAMEHWLATAIEEFNGRFNAKHGYGQAVLRDMYDALINHRLSVPQSSERTRELSRQAGSPAYGEQSK